MLDKQGGNDGTSDLERQLVDALDRLDALAAVERAETPDIRLLVARSRRRGLWLELVRFWLLALAAVSAGLICLRLDPVVYLALQGILAGGFIIAALAAGGRTNGWVKR